MPRTGLGGYAVRHMIRGLPPAIGPVLQDGGPLRFLMLVCHGKG